MKEGNPEEAHSGLAELEVERLLHGHGDAILGAEQVRMNFQRVEQPWFA